MSSEIPIRLQNRLKRTHLDFHTLFVSAIWSNKLVAIKIREIFSVVGMKWVVDLLARATSRIKISVALNRKWLRVALESGRDVSALALPLTWQSNSFGEYILNLSCPAVSTLVLVRTQSSVEGRFLPSRRILRHFNCVKFCRSLQRSEQDGLQ
jgi:hypothetical protein